MEAMQKGWPCIRSHPLYAKWKEQSAWSDELIEAAETKFDGDVTERLRCLRNLQCTPNSGLWLTRPPGKTEPFSAPEYQALLKFRTGVPLYPEGSVCTTCGQGMDPWGDHALCCSHAGTSRRHNRVRNTIWALAEEAGWRPSLEATLEGTLLRPADVLLRSLYNRPIALDVTVVHPLRLSQQNVAMRGEPSLTAMAAERAKIAESADLCAAKQWGFRPFGADCTGGLGPGARLIVRQLQRYLCMPTGVPIAEMASYVGGAISSALAKGLGEMLVAATPPR